MSDFGGTRCASRHSHEDTSQIQLDLETDVNVRAIDGGAPPECEPTVRNLVETGPLSVGELLVPHRLFEAGRLLPEETLPGREVGTLEERVLEDTLHTAERGDDIDTVVVELPQLAVVALRRPPEGVAETIVSARVKWICTAGLTA